jgi:lipopolysaccharide export system protein LptA
MKIFLLISASLATPLCLYAQTNATVGTHDLLPAISALGSTAHTNVVMRAPTEIFSDQGDFDLRTQVAIYTGHVRVIDPQMTLTCEVLTARVPQGGGRVDHIVAERNVVIDATDNRGEPIHATAQKAVYTYKLENSVTKETIELTGDPQPHIQSPFRSGTGDIIVWDRINSTFHGSNLHMIFQQPVKEAATNRPPASVNATNTP